jgi:hypothetical protein
LRIKEFNTTACCKYDIHHLTNMATNAYNPAPGRDSLRGTAPDGDNCHTATLAVAPIWKEPAS